MSTKTNMEIQNYKDLKNYIHNYLGLTKEEVRAMVKEVVQQYVETEVKKCLSDEQRLEHLIEKEILRQIKYNNQDYQRKYFIQNTLDAIYNRIDTVIHDEVLKRLQITLREPDTGGDE